MSNDPWGELKSPMQLLEEFATDMMVWHGIHVTEVNFGDNGMDKFSLSFGKHALPVKNEGVSLNFAWTSAGRIKLGTAEEIK